MITCRICFKEFNAINKRHLFSHHLTRDAYVLKFPDAPLQSAESAARRKAASLVREANMSAETKAVRAGSISQSKVGKTSWNTGKGGYKLQWSDEAKQRRSDSGAWNKGIPVSEEQKQKQSEKMKEGYTSGRIKHANLGKRMPDEVRRKITESCKKYKLTSEQKEKQLDAIRLWVNSPAFRSGMSTKKHTVTDRQNISKRVKEAYPKIRRSMEDGGYWIPLAQLSEFIKYRREVWKHTNKNAPLIHNYDAAKRGRCSKSKDNWQVDHKLSITHGWLGGVSASDLSHLANLQFIPWRENLYKWHGSSMRKEELMKMIVVR